MNRRNKRYYIPRILPILFVVLFLQISSVWAEGVTKVETKYTCMVNNTVFPKVQIPTVVEGRTYYGCCEMCAEKLANNEAIRKTIDPVSGKDVDKATAVIGVDKRGKAYYFENDKNLQAFSLKN